MNWVVFANQEKLYGRVHFSIFLGGGEWLNCRVLLQNGQRPLKFLFGYISQFISSSLHLSAAAAAMLQIIHSKA